jgi:hypothetical protein
MIIKFRGYDERSIDMYTNILIHINIYLSVWIIIGSSNSSSAVENSSNNSMGGNNSMSNGSFLGGIIYNHVYIHLEIDVCT